MYGVLERQFRRYFAEAERRKGNTGSNLLMLLESRLDNVVYRMGFGSRAPRRASWSRTRGITVNGEVVNIPSYLVKAGDTVAVRESPRSSCASPTPSALQLAEGRHAGLGEVDANRLEASSRRPRTATSSAPTSTNR